MVDNRCRKSVGCHVDGATADPVMTGVAEPIELPEKHSSSVETRSRHPGIEQGIELVCERRRRRRGSRRSRTCWKGLGRVASSCWSSFVVVRVATRQGSSVCRVDVWQAVVTSYMLMARGAVEGKTDGESKINTPLNPPRQSCQYGSSPQPNHTTHAVRARHSPVRSSHP